MPLRRWLGRTVFVAMAASIPPVAMAQALQQFTLANGMTLIVKPDRRAPTAALMLWVRVGSMDEVDGTTGVAHVLEHMLFKGTQKRGTPIEVAEELDKIGGDYNAFTGEEYTGYYAKVDSSHFNIALDWVFDIFLNSKISQGNYSLPHCAFQKSVFRYVTFFGWKIW